MKEVRNILNNYQIRSYEQTTSTLRELHSLFQRTTSKRDRDEIVYFIDKFESTLLGATCNSSTEAYMTDELMKDKVSEEEPTNVVSIFTKC